VREKGGGGRGDKGLGEEGRMVVRQKAGIREVIGWSGRRGAGMGGIVREVGSRRRRRVEEGRMESLGWGVRKILAGRGE